MALSKSVRKGQSPVCCNLCEVENKISWKCLDCELLMCNKCTDRIHPKIKNARDHRVINIKDVGLQTEEVDFSNIKCKEHKNQVCFMFCKSCEQLVCPQCIAKIHNGHGLVEISEGYQIQMERLKGGHNQMKADVDTLNKRESNIQEIKKAENAKYMEAKKKIQAHNTSLKKAVDQYTEKLFNELDQKWELSKDSIEKEENRMGLLKKNMADKNNFVEDILNSNDAEKIFDESKELEKYIKAPLEPSNDQFPSMPYFLPGEISQYNVGALQNTSADITLKVIKEYTTDISKILFMSPCVNSLWISDQNAVQKVQPAENNLKVISSFDMKVYGMAVTPSNDLLLIPKGTVIKRMNGRTGQMTDFCNISPLDPIAVHVTSDYKVIVGGMNFEESRNAVVYMMDKEGKSETIHEFDKNNQSIFTNPLRLTTTKNGNVFVVDKLSDDESRVVVLGQEGDIINFYSGHPEINTKDKPFKSKSIVTTPSDNIIVTNNGIGILHILNNLGHLIRHVNTGDKGIQRPFSITFDKTGKVYIGCTTTLRSTDKAKLYEVKLLDC